MKYLLFKAFYILFALSILIFGIVFTLIFFKSFSPNGSNIDKNTFVAFNVIILLFAFPPIIMVGNLIYTLYKRINLMKNGIKKVGTIVSHESGSFIRLQKRSAVKAVLELDEKVSGFPKKFYSESYWSSPWEMSAPGFIKKGTKKYIYFSQNNPKLYYVDIVSTILN